MLQGKANFVITHCIRKELETLGIEVKDAFEYSKNIRRIKCHHDPPISAYECLLDIASIIYLKFILFNKIEKQTKLSSEKYFFATQDPKLKSNARQIPGVPLISFNRSVLVLDAPSHQNMRELTSIETEKRGMSEKEKEILCNEYHIEPGDDSVSKPIKRKHKPQGPNPLSCLKKKSGERIKIEKIKDGEDEEKEEGERKRKRTRRSKKKPKKSDESVEKEKVVEEEEKEEEEEEVNEEDE